MSRVASIYLPRWPVTLAKRKRLQGQLSARRDRTAVLLTRQSPRGDVVAACCDRAEARGVRVGLSIEHAVSLIGSRFVAILPFTPEADRTALAALGRWALHFTPVVALHPPDGLLLDIAGCEHLFGGESSMLALLAARLDRLCLPSRIAIAPTIGCAIAVARYHAAPHNNVSVEQVAEVLFPLPVTALRIDDVTADTLAEIGIHTIGQVHRIPRTDLAARFGGELLRRLDAALGLVPEHVEPHRPVAPLSEFHDFDGPVTNLAVVEFVAHELLTCIVERLSAQQHGARILEYTIRHADRTQSVVRQSLTRANQNLAHIWSVLHPQFQRLQSPFGVESIRLEVVASDTVSAHQIPLWRDDVIESRGDTERAFGELIDRMAQRFGNAVVFAALRVDTYVPEQAYTTRPHTDTQTDKGAPNQNVNRPSRLFEEPEPARVLAIVPDGPPARVEWRGAAFGVQFARGPERLALPWWSAPVMPARDYFEVQLTNGRFVWLFRESDSGRWFVHGEWA
ncbi:MAG: DNA polymerase Y family protein [Phycisphaerales bacterium]|nr:DNA polymerase Y family protein [Phycisphaerales bacterium]